MTSEALNDAVEKAVAREIAALKKDLSADLQQGLSAALNSILGNSSLAGPVAAGFSNVLDSLLTGNKINARSVANATATSLAPQIGDFFNQSASQLGESLAVLFSSAQRNF